MLWLLASWGHRHSPLGSSITRRQCMDLSPQTHDVLAATILALVSVVALVLVLSGLRRRGGKFRVSVRYGKAQ